MPKNGILESGRKKLVKADILKQVLELSVGSKRDKLRRLVNKRGDWRDADKQPDFVGEFRVLG